MGREAQIYVAIGRRGIGKTWTTVQKLREYVRGNPAKGVPGRPVLIFDVNDEFSNRNDYPDFRTMRMSDIPRFAARRVPQIRRITPYFDHGGKMKMGQDMIDALEYILSTYYNGLLVVEDINKYVSDHMPNDLIGNICTNRHEGIDILLHYQSIGRVATKVWQNIDTLRMHKETAGVERNRGKFEEHYQIFKIAENIVNREYDNGNERFYLYVDVARKKIKAAVSVETMRDAITEYCWQDNRTIISRTMNTYDRTMQTRTFKTEAEAYMFLEKKFLKDYFEVA